MAWPDVIPPQNPSLPKEHPLAVASRLGDPCNEGKEALEAKKEMTTRLKERTLKGLPPQTAASASASLSASGQDGKAVSRPSIRVIRPIAGGKGGACDVEEDEG